MRRDILNYCSCRKVFVCVQKCLGDAEQLRRLLVTGYGLMTLTLHCRNYTMKVMPTPLNDAAAALRINQTKTEQALRKVMSICLTSVFLIAFVFP